MSIHDLAPSHPVVTAFRAWQKDEDANYTAVRHFLQSAGADIDAGMFAVFLRGFTAAGVQNRTVDALDVG